MTDPDAAAFNERIKAMSAFVEARCDEDELWATEASRRDGHAPPAGGVHWQWETEHDVVIALDPLTMAYVDEGSRYASLRSREEFDTRSAGMLPQFAISSAEEVPVAVGGHIIRHDPARVLREIAAKRGRTAALVAYARKADEVRENPDRFGEGNRGEILGMLMAYMHAASADAEVWSGHPAYDAKWRVGP